MPKKFMILQASILCCLLWFFSNARGQSPNIEVTHIVAPVTQLSVSDIDFRNSTTPKWLFTINIRVLDGSSIRAVMAMQAGFSIPNENPFPDAVAFTTDTFVVNGMRSVTNLDLDRGIRLKSYTVNKQAKRRLEEVALPTGQIPAGTYMFHVEVSPAGGTSRGTDFSIVLSNPTTVELISPIDGDQLSSQFPLFQWQYDGPSSRISIFEKLQGQATLEEAAGGIAHYSTTTTSNSLQYPPSRARILEPGKTYVWFVEGLSGTTGGTTVGRKSALRSFTIPTNASQSLSSILDELARALPQYQSLFDDLKAQGFTSASSIRLNDSAISTADLLRLVNKLRQSPDAVTTVGLE